MIILDCEYCIETLLTDIGEVILSLRKVESLLVQ